MDIFSFSNSTLNHVIIDNTNKAPLLQFTETENFYKTAYESVYDPSYNIQFVFYDEEEIEEEELDENTIAPLDISPSGQFLQSLTTFQRNTSNHRH